MVLIFYITNHCYTGIHVTGCDSGFGRLLAESLDRAGVPVFAGYFLDSSERELRKKCSSKMKLIQVDVTDSQSVKKAADFVDKELAGKGEVEQQAP